MAFWGLRGWERASVLQRAEAGFEEHAEHVSLLLQQDVARQLATVDGVGALFEASAEVTRTEFETFARGLLERNPSIRWFAWAPGVREADRAAFEARVRREVPGYSVRSAETGSAETGSAETGSAETGSAHVRFPVEYMSPPVGPAELGLDLASVPVLRQATRNAAASGRSVTVGPLSLAPLGGGEGVGVAVLLPFYRAPGDNAEPALQGFVVELLDVGAMVRAALGERELDAWLSDTAGREVMALHAGAATEPTRAAPATGPVTRSGLTVGDQLWILTLAPSIATVPTGPGYAAWVVLFVGIAASAGGAAYLARLRRHAEDLSSANTALHEEMARRQEAERMRERLSGVVEATSDLVAMADPEDHLFYLNRAGRAMVGLGEQDNVGRTLLTDLLTPASRLRVPPVTTLDRTQWQGEIELRRRDGSEVPALGVVQTHLGPDGEVEYRSAIAHDIRERKAAERQLEHHAYYDELTELPNRRLLERRLGEIIASAKGRVTVLLVNPDRFRFVSFTLGPAYRDQTMRALARRLETLVRPGELLAYYAGDTLALILPGGGAGRVRRVRDALFEAMVEPLLVNGTEFRLGLSIGACFFPDDGTDVTALLLHAHAALHRATELGGGTCQLFTAELHQRMRDRVTLEAELRCALDRDELTLHYQPQVDLASGRLAGVEALLRWRHPRLGILGPSQFVTVAEESRLILPIGNWAIETACRQARRWREAGVPTLQMGVNVSAYQLGEADLEARIRRAMRDGDIHAGELELELTESALMADPGEVREIFARLRESGCRIAIDDFGTGYSCLSYLKQLPVDRLKIDQSFVRDVATDPRSAGIVRTIIAMAGHFGMETIAEGVTNAEQVAFLRREGCPEIQGYFVSQPLPPDEIPGLEAALRTRPLVRSA